MTDLVFKDRPVIPGFLLLAALAAAPAGACPVCDSDTGKQVRAGLFDADFASNLLAVALPFPIFLGITALIYYGPPIRRRQKEAPGNGRG